MSTNNAQNNPPSNTTEPIAITELVIQVLTSPNDQELLQKLLARIEELVAYSESEEGARLALEPYAAQNPEWAAVVSHCIMSAVDELIITPEQRAAQNSLVQAWNADRRSLGAAFLILLNGLPQPLLEPNRWFPRSALLTHDLLPHLLSQPDVQAAGSHGERFARYGSVSPTIVGCATQAIEFQIEYLRVSKQISPDTTITLSKNGDLQTTSSKVDVACFVQEVVRMTECSESMSRALLAWLIQVAHYKPYVFPGYKAVPVGEAINLVSSDCANDGPEQLWARTNGQAA